MIKNLLKRFNRKKEESSLMTNYNRLPVAFLRGEGMRLWDQNDKEYIDALGGIAVNILGHKHPRFTGSLKKMAEGVIHTSNLFQIPSQEALADRLCEISGMSHVFLCNSGTEANEAAIKLARKYGNNKNIENPTIVTTTGSFHGRTMASLAATGNDSVKQNFGPMLSGFLHVPYNNIAALDQLTDNEDIVAVMLEPIQGESGIIIPDKRYLAEVRAICDQNDWLLIVDEVQTGIGRTGKWCAFQHSNMLPDVITFAKALGNGIPIGACAATGKAAMVLQPGDHGSTFGGNPFASSVASEVLDIIKSDDLVKHAQTIGDYLLNSLKLHLGENARVVEVRGKGLMLAVELDKAYKNLAQQFLDAGLIINITGEGKIIRLLPPMIMQEADANLIAKLVSQVINLQKS